MFVEDEAEIASRVGGAERGILDFGKLLRESEEQEFGLGGVESQKVCSYQGRDLLKRFLKDSNAGVEVRRVKTEKELSVICIEMVVEGKGRDKNTERSDVHYEE